MKDNPMKAVNLMLYLLGTTMVLIPILGIFNNEKTPEWFLAVMFLFCSQCVVSAAMKNMAQRIETLENKLQKTQSGKEAV